MKKGTGGLVVMHFFGRNGKCGCNTNVHCIFPIIWGLPVADTGGQFFMGQGQEDLKSVWY